MRIWLIKIGDPLPSDPGNVRLLHTSVLAGFLADQGHEVLWWTSTFNHTHKTHRFRRDTELRLRDNYRLRLLHGPGYRRNVSLARLWDHYQLGRKFRHQAGSEPPPDVILCTLPTLELSAEAVAYGRARGVPVVLDISDMWPDVFLEAFPSWSRGAARIALRPQQALARRACAGAFAITGHGPAFVDWGLACGRRTRSPWDRDFPFAYAIPELTAEQERAADEFWRRHGIEPASPVPTVCFCGTIGRQFELETVLEAARRIQRHRPVRFVLCGDGDRLADYRRLAADCPAVILPGWIHTPEIWTLMRRSCLGLAPYRNTHNFRSAIQTKVLEYLAAGLPVLTSLPEGMVRDLLVSQDCGDSYDGDPRRLEERILAWCAAPERHAALSRNARRVYQSQFTVPAVYGTMAEYLTGIAAHRRRARAA